MKLRILMLVAALTSVVSMLAGVSSAANASVTATGSNTFSPSSVTIEVGDSVTWTGLQGGFHNVTSSTGAFQSPNGASEFTQTFSASGTYSYLCTNHFGMSGSVTVGSASTATSTPSPTPIPPSACGGTNVAAVMLTSPFSSAATFGSVRFYLDSAGTALTGQWALSGLSSSITAAHIHRLSDGAVVVPSASASFTGLSGTSGSFTTTNTAAADITAFQAVLANPSAYYVNVHTSNNPSGEIRGTLACSPAVVANTVVGSLTGSQQVPPVTTNGSGSVALVLDPTAATIDGQWTIGGLSSNATLAHIHVGAAGTNGPVIVDFSSQLPAAGGTFTTRNVGVSADVIRAVQYVPSGFYVNVHTASNSSGELRGQLAVLRGFLPIAHLNAQLSADSPRR